MLMCTAVAALRVYALSNMRRWAGFGVLLIGMTPVLINLVSPGRNMFQWSFYSAVP